MAKDKKNSDETGESKKNVKIYKGTVIEAFKHGKKQYPVGSTWTTELEASFQYLINIKKIKE